MAFDDLVNKAKEALNTDKGEEISDKVLDGAENLANKVTGNKFQDQVAGVKENIDKTVGNN